MTELHDLSALELAERIRNKTLRSEELVEHYLARIERLDPRYSAFVTVTKTRARWAAQHADKKRGEPGTGFFHGVPTGIKDLHFVRGVFTRSGTNGLPPIPAPADDVLVSRVRSGGFVFVGKTTTSELALLPVVEPDIHPPTRNPWDPERTSGGSSGGAAAAVAAHLLPLAPGSDGAGSVRIPAALCGLFGFKPTHSIVPNAHASIDGFGMTAVGPIARTVEDGAALLDVLTGYRPGVTGSFLASARSRPPRMKIGLLVRSPLGKTDATWVKAAEEAARELERRGHEVIPLEPVRTSIDEFIPIYSQLVLSIPILFESKLQPVTRWFREQGRRYTKDQVRERYESLKARVLESFGDADVVLTPTSAVGAPKVFSTRDLTAENTFRELSHLGAFTASANVLASPGASVPWSIVDGMPTGVQLLGRPGEDRRVMALAAELEALRGGRFVAPGIA